MSEELKTYDLPVDHGDFTPTVELFYLKSEADVVIAELKTKNTSLINEINEWVQSAANRPIVIGRLRQHITVLDTELRHHKYKRCLAMAKWCGYFANYWECCEPPDCWAFIARAKFYRKWLKRWLALAEKFKEAK